MPHHAHASGTYVWAHKFKLRQTSIARPLKAGGLSSTASTCLSGERAAPQGTAIKTGGVHVSTPLDANCC